MADEVGARGTSLCNKKQGELSFALRGFAVLGLSTKIFLVVRVSTACGARQEFLDDADRESRHNLTLFLLAHDALLSYGTFLSSGYHSLWANILLRNVHPWADRISRARPKIFATV